MKKKFLLATTFFPLIAVFAFSLTACNNIVITLDKLQNEYGIIAQGGGFEKGSTLISNEIAADTKEGAEALAQRRIINYQYILL